jgi:hypothetical protein
MKYNRLTIIEKVYSQIHISPITWKKRTIQMVHCACDCWNKIVTRVDYVRNWQSKSCGCLQKEKAQKSIKELHKKQLKEWNPNWKWWIKKFSRTIRDCDKYIDWRNKVFQRDKYTCQISWINKWYLAVHHITNFNDILIRNNIVTLEEANSCEELWNIDNWITISNSIHNKFHKQYWYRTNTIEQIQEFKMGYPGA